MGDSRKSGERGSLHHKTKEVSKIIIINIIFIFKLNKSLDMKDICPSEENGR